MNDGQTQAPGASVRAEGTLRPGRNCWRIAHADRARVLIDAQAYFSMLGAALRRAEHEILIVGWDIHALMRLDPAAPGEGHAENLRELLLALATRNEALEIRLLLWDFTVLYTSDRLPFPKAVLDWSMPANVRLALDNRVPAGASHHQKIVVIDNRLAFIGGLDLTEARWDTPAHANDEARRVTARGERYPPFHDVQLALDGDAAAALGAHCRERWSLCTGEAPGNVETAASDPWPDACDATWEDVDVGIARTLPDIDGSEPVTEIAELYLDSIAAARECIYIENQYLTADRVCDALVASLGAREGPEIVLVTQWSTHSWLEENTMGIRRQRFLGRLRKADARGRLRVCAPRVPGIDIEAYKLHSKVTIVDDRLVRIGSANLNNRSMGFDSECDAAVACRTRRDRQAARSLRARLLAEHLGIEAAELEREIQERGSVIATIDALSGEGRSLVAVPLPDEPPPDGELLAELADPERPLSARDLIDRLSPNAELTLEALDKTALRRAAKVVAAIVAAIALVLIWRATPLSEIADPTVAADLLSTAAGSRFGAPIALAAFVLGGLVVFPVTILILAAGVAFGPWLGLLYAALGTYLSAAVNFGLGRALGRKPFERFESAALNKVTRRLVRNGIVATAFLRIVPVAPFSIVNLLAGVSPITFRDYALGTVLGMTPGIFVLVVLGGQLGELLENPSLGQIMIVTALGLVWIGIGFALQRLIDYLERKRERRTSEGT